ncbi:hypothetical protein [Tabrizicola sp.]|uniref:hypothetical protein n=1 Tax=Tabrizicola sp. TaxID=2005166 RepID=UPI003F40ADD1
MNMKQLLVAGYLGAILASTALTPVSAEVLRVMQGQAQEALNVPMNRAVVVEEKKVCYAKERKDGQLVDTSIVIPCKDE